MKRLLLSFTMAASCLAASTGCHTLVTRDPCGCRSCGNVHGVEGCGGLFGDAFCGIRERKLAPPPAGPPAPTVTYPYYTTRAPRDFLLDDPPSIGR